MIFLHFRQFNPRGLVVGAALIVGLTFLLSLMNYPPPTGDDGLYASAAVSLLERGTVGQIVYGAGDPWDRDVNAITFGRSYIAGLAVMLRIFGVSPTIARAYSWLGWLMASLLVSWLGTLVYDRRVGLFAAFLFATGTKALFTAHLARPESWTTSASLLAVIATLGALDADHRPIITTLAAGVMSVWPADFHGTGLAFSLGLALAVGLSCWQRRDARKLVAYTGGALIGLGLWFVLHLGLSGIRDGAELFFGFFRPVQSAGGSSESLRIIWLERLSTLPDWAVSIFWTAGGPLSLLEGGLALYGSLFALFRGSPTDRTLLTVTLGALVAFGLLIPFRHLQYGILWVPYWALLGTRAVFATGDWLAARFTLYSVRLRLVAPFALSALIVGNYIADLWLIYRWRGADYDRTGQAIAALVPENTRVLADTVWWWALRTERVFLTDDYFVALAAGQHQSVQRFLGVDAPLAGDQLVERTLQVLRPDIVILDGALSSHVGPEPTWITLKEIVEEQCSFVGVVPGPWADDSTKGFTQLGQVSTVYACRDW